jgi:hypothetical protein
MKTLFTTIAWCVSAYVIGQNYTICAGSTITLTATNPLSLSNPTYVLEPGSVAKLVPQFTATLSSTTAYSLYTFGTNSSSAVVSSSLTVTVFVQTVIPSDFTSTLATQCITNGSVNLLSIVQNTSGVFSGPGVSGNAFFPGAAGTGTHILTYMTATNNCVSTSSLAVGVTSLAVPVFTLPPFICSDTPPFQVNVTPPGGVFSSTPAMISLNGFVTPSSVPQGIYTISYSISNGACLSSTSSIYQAVQTPSPVITLPGVTHFPNCGPPWALFGIPSGGTFSGNGIVNGLFYPGQAGLGTHLITYSISNLGCVGMTSATISVVDCLETGSHSHEIFEVAQSGDAFRITIRERSLPALFSLYDAGGRLLRRMVFTEPQNNLEYGEFAPGLYILVFDGSDYHKATKVIR